MTDEWVPAPPQPPPDPPPGLPPANTWSAVAPCAAPDSPSIVGSIIITDVPATIVAPYAWGITLNDGGSPPNFSIDHFDGAGALIESPIVIEGSSGDVMLTHDPTDDLGAATKHYVDTTGLREAPVDNTTYGRDNGAWVPLPASYMPEAPNTSQRYGRFNSIWQLDAIQTDAPSDGAAYARQNGGWTAAVTGGPYMPISGGTFTGVVTFPSNNSIAINGPSSTAHAILGQVAGLARWQLNLPDQTSEGVGNAGSNFSLSAYSTTGGFLGTWLTIARADGAATFAGAGVTLTGGLAVNGGLAITNVGNLSIPGGNPGDALTTNGSAVLSWAPRLADAPSDGNYYTRRNAAWAIAPGGMTDAPNDGTAYARKSAAWAHLTHTDITDWTASLAPYALTASVPVASSSTPAMDGTAAVGTGTTWARADHVHPSDTSRYAASNPSGYQTAAQVTASLASYLPIAGGTLTGALIGTSFAFNSGVITGALGVNGLLTVGAGSGAANLILNGGAGSNRFVLGQTNGLSRWGAILGNTTAESGSNVGSDFQINRYNDAGVLVDAPFSITRSTGAATFVASVTTTSLRQNAHGFTFNYVANGALNQFACTIDGAYNVIVKSVSVSPFTSVVDTMALNAAGSAMGAWAGGSAAQWAVAVTSDRRLKSNLAPSSKDALDVLAAIPVYQCDMTPPFPDAEPQHWDFAVIADEVKPEIPLAVNDPIPEAGFNYATMRDYPFIPVLIRAVQQLTARVAELEAQLKGAT